MINYRNALECIIAASSLKPAVDLPLVEAVGRVASQDVVSIAPHPRFRNSAMDGFAMRSKETQNASPGSPRRFIVIGTFLAGDGDLKMPDVEANQAVAIMTGAPIPSALASVGFDAVVPVEDVTRAHADGVQTVELRRSLKCGENIRDAGEDYPSGTTLLLAGDVVTPGHALVLASAGVCRVLVREKPRIAVLSTGNELVDIFGTARNDLARSNPLCGQTLATGKIFNSTAPFLLTSLSTCGADATYYGIVVDHPEEFSKTLDVILRDPPDAIVSTGAVSMGVADFIPTALRDAGGEVLFHKALIRPGKPVLFGRLKREEKPILFFGLPGNPLSVVAGMRFFVTPYLLAATGRATEEPLKATMVHNYQKPPKLRTFCLGSLQFGEGGPEISVDQTQRSFMVTPTVRCNAWAVLPEGTDMVRAGEKVECLWLYPPNA